MKNKFDEHGRCECLKTNKSLVYLQKKEKKKKNPSSDS